MSLLNIHHINPANISDVAKEALSKPVSSNNVRVVRKIERTGEFKPVQVEPKEPKQQELLLDNATTPRPRQSV